MWRFVPPAQANGRHEWGTPTSLKCEVRRFDSPTLVDKNKSVDKDGARSFLVVGSSKGDLPSYL
jgi:hypothetical protein